MESCDPILVRQQLARILASPEFAQAERLGEFLRFVVETCLSGRGQQLKETVIGVEVYHRDPAYDPRTEPIVRTEARRLRAKLDEYYQAPGRNDPVLIELPKGAYVARFESKPVALPVPAPIPAAITPLPPRQGSRWKWAVACLGICALLGVYLILRPRNPPPIPVVRPLTSYPGYEFQPALSPDGKQFAFVYNGDSNNYDIYVKLLDAGAPLRLTTNPAHDLHPTWSPDGRYIAFLRVSPDRQEIFVVPALGGAERRIAGISSADAAWEADAFAMHNAGPAWSPDGKYLAVGDRPAGQGPDAIYFIAAATGTKRKLTSPPPDSIGDSMPAFSPDGRRIAFVRAASQRGITDIFVIPADGGAEKRLTSDRKTITGLTWASGRRLLFSSNRAGANMLWSIPADGGAVEMEAIAGRGVRQVAASADGSRVLYTDRVQNSNIWRVDLTRAGAAPERFLASTGRNDSPQYSPDGKRIVFGSDRSGWYELWTANADGSNLLQITNFGGLPVGTPRWSPDGRQIVFDAVKDGRSVIYLINSDGGQPQLFLEGPGDTMMPNWSRDGEAIYFVTRRDGNALDLWKKPVGTGPMAEIARPPAGEAFESPDGRSIYYSDGQNGIWQVAHNGSGAHLIAALAQVHDSRYSAVTSRGIYFLRNSEPPCQIQLYDFATGRVEPVAGMAGRPSFGTPSLSVSPDDHWLIYAQIDAIGSDIMMLTGLR